MLDKLLSLKKSDTVFIIGGGESLNKYLPDPRILDGQDIILTNNAYTLFPEAMMLYFFDWQWFEFHEKNLKDFKGLLISAENHNRERLFKANITVFKRDIDRGISERPDTLQGSNSGHMAINIAILMKYSKIVLIGFDMHSNVSKLHWHEGHFRPTNSTRYDKIFIPAMETIVPYQEKLGFKIYNINRESALQCFEFADLNQFVNINNQEELK